MASGMSMGWSSSMSMGSTASYSYPSMGMDSGVSSYRYSSVSGLAADDAMASGMSMGWSSSMSMGSTASYSYPSMEFLSQSTPLSLQLLSSMSVAELVSPTS